jgi:hypothetical protein
MERRELSMLYRKINSDVPAIQGRPMIDQRLMVHAA